MSVAAMFVHRHMPPHGAGTPTAAHHSLLHPHHPHIVSISAGTGTTHGGAPTRHLRPELHPAPIGSSSAGRSSGREDTVVVVAPPRRHGSPLAPSPKARGSRGGRSSPTVGSGGSGNHAGRTAGAVTVRAAEDTPGNVTVGPYLFDLALGLHMADTKTPADAIQAHYRGGTLTVEGEPTPRWLAYIQAARDRHEQTMEAFRDPRGYIYFRTMRPLRAGQELLVWYGDELARECGIPVLTPSNIRGDQQYVCTTCSKSYKHPNCLKAHIRFRCAPTTRLDFLVSSRVLPTSTPTPDSWLHLSTTPAPRRSLQETASRRSPEVRSPEVQTTSGPAGPMNLKVGAGSAFRPPPPRRDSSGEEISRQQSPDSTRDLRDESPRKEHKDKSMFPSLLPPPPTTAAEAMSSGDREKRCGLTSPHKAVSLKDTAGKFPLHPEVPGSRLPQHLQLFNHLPPPAFPFPMDSATALKYYYTPLYNKLSAAAAGQMCYNRMLLSKPQCLPGNYLDSAMYYHQQQQQHPHHPFASQKHTSPNSEQENHKMEDSLKQVSHHNTGSPEGACLPFTAFPLPSENAGEPLDLLPRSLYMHKSRKGHLCIYCGKMYSRKYGLKIHLRTHTGYKPLKCKVCLRPFGDPSNLNKHIRLHAEGETPYRCEYCGKVLVRRRDLERHIKSRHPNQAEARLALDETEVSSSGKQAELLRSSPCFSLTDSTEDSLDGDGSKDFIDVQEEGEEEGDFGDESLIVDDDGDKDDDMELGDVENDNLDDDDDDDDQDDAEIEVVS